MIMARNRLQRHFACDSAQHTAGPIPGRTGLSVAVDSALQHDTIPAEGINLQRRRSPTFSGH